MLLALRTPVFQQRHLEGGERTKILRRDLFCASTIRAIVDSVDHFIHVRLGGLDLDARTRGEEMYSFYSPA